MFYILKIIIYNIGKRLALTKILITPHGANMANMIFLPTNSIVIEILPYRCQRLRIFFPNGNCYRYKQCKWR